MRPGAPVSFIVTVVVVVVLNYSRDGVLASLVYVPKFEEWPV